MTVTPQWSYWGEIRRDWGEPRKMKWLPNSSQPMAARSRPKSQLPFILPSCVLLLLHHANSKKKCLLAGMGKQIPKVRTFTYVLIKKFKILYNLLISAPVWLCESNRSPVHKSIVITRCCHIMQSIPGINKNLLYFDFLNCLGAGS